MNWWLILIILVLIILVGWYWMRVRNAVTFKAMGQSGKEMLSVQINGKIVASNINMTKDFKTYTLSSIEPIKTVTINYINPGLGKLVQIEGGRVMVGGKNILNERLSASQTTVMQNVSNLLNRAVAGTLVRGGSYKMTVNK